MTNTYESPRVNSHPLRPCARCLFSIGLAYIQIARILHVVSAPRVTHWVTRGRWPAPTHRIYNPRPRGPRGPNRGWNKNSPKLVEAAAKRNAAQSLGITTATYLAFLREGMPKPEQAAQLWIAERKTRIARARAERMHIYAHQRGATVRKCAELCGVLPHVVRHHIRKNGAPRNPNAFTLWYQDRIQNQRSRSIEARYGTPEQRKARRRWRMRAYCANKAKTNPSYRIYKCQLARMHKALKKQGITKSTSTREDIGCSYLALSQWLESQFLPGMTWQNYGTTWHVDHIFPASRANLADPEQLRKVCHFTNLQPLWADENIRKSNRLDYAAA